MLPGFSSKNEQTGGGKKSKKKNYHENEMNEILLHYNLERMDEDHHQYHVSHCDIHRDMYPFASSLSKETDYDSLLSECKHDDSSIEEGRDQGDCTEIHICVYQINTSCEVPFIEYLMTLSDDKNGGEKVFEFPKFEYVSSKRKDVVEQAEKHVSNILMQNGEEHTSDNINSDVIKFRGLFKYTSRGSSKKTKSNIYFLFQKYFKKTTHPPLRSKRHRIWWAVVSEIVNFKRIMYMNIDPTITELFIKNPEIMRLYDCSGRVLETPTICYFGDEFQKIKYLAFFGLLKAPVKSSFGPFYVATNFLSSMKYACYTHNQQPFELYTGEKITKGEHGKYKEGGVLRMILFVGKMNVFLRHGPPDDSQISQELAKTDETIEKFLPLRDSNGNWTEQYDTAYKGLHFASINGDIAVNPVEWFFKDYNHSVVISYHNIDTDNIPVKFDVDYVEYKLK